MRAPSDRDKYSITVPSLDEPCPCDGCRFAVRCGPERLACAAFSMYINAKPEKRWRHAPRVPTRGQWVALFAG